MPMASPHPMPTESEQELERLRRELAELKSTLRESGDGGSQSIEGLNVLALRVGADGNVSYVNTELARAFHTEKSEWIGRPLEELARLFGGEVVSVLTTSERSAESGPRTAKDAQDRVFEIRIHFRGKAGLVRDIVLHDVTDQQRMRAYARKYFPADFDKLSDDDLRSFKFPERRFMSVTFTDLRGFTALSEQLSPEEVRAVVNAYMEEVAQAIQAAGGTVDKFVGDEVMALFGAPLYYADHAFRAVACACEQIDRVERLRRQFDKAGKSLPPCGIGLNAGDMVLGNMGSATRQNYTVLGPAVNLASRLCGAATGGQALLTESYFQQAVRQMPSGWVSTNWTERLPQADTGSSTGPATGGKVESMKPLPPALEGRVIGIGPEGEDPVYIFRYRYLLEVKGVSAPIITLSVEQARTESAVPLVEEASQPERSERLLGRYRLDRPIGRGGMGEVWRARDQFGNRVAVKTLLSGEAATEAQIRRFKREAEIMSRLQHRNLCRVFEVGEWERQHYIAMELVDGVSLRDLMRRPAGATSASGTKSSLAEAVKETRAQQSSAGHSSGGDSVNELSELIREVKSNITHASEIAEAGSGLIPVESRDEAAPTGDEPEVRVGRVFPRQQALSLVHQIGQGVQAAHGAGVLHRDLKPANILLRENGEPVVMDFGLAKLHREDGGELSLSGQVLGTIEYMAPEQARSAKEIDERADVFSLGAILYEMVTGRKCLQATGNMLVDSRKLEQFEPERASKYNRRIDSDLDAILLKALSTDPKQRYRGITAFLSDIEAYQQGRVVSAKTPNSAEILWKLIRRNQSVSVTIAVAVLVFLMGAAYAFYWINQERTIASLQREAAEARNHLKHEPSKSLSDVREATMQSIADLGEVLPSVQFALGDVMVQAPQVWRAYLGKEPVTSLTVLPASGERPLYVAAVQGNKLFWLDERGRLVGEPVVLDAIDLRRIKLETVADDQGSPEIVILGTGQYASGPGEPLRESPSSRNAYVIQTSRTDLFWPEGERTKSIPALEKEKERMLQMAMKETSIAWSPKGQTAKGMKDGTIRTEAASLPGENWKEITIRGHTNAVTALAFDASGDRLASGSADRTIRITGPEGQYLGDAIRGHEGTIEALAWADDGMTLYSAGSDGTVRRWDVSMFQTRPPEPIDISLPQETGPVTVTNGQWVAESDGSSLVKLRPFKFAGKSSELYGHWGVVTAMAFSPDGKTLATGGADNAVMLWNLDGDLISPPIMIHIAPIAELKFSADGKRVITYSEDGTSREVAATPEGWLEQLERRKRLDQASDLDTYEDCEVE